MKATKIIATLSAAGALAMVSCSPAQQQYALGGAAAGAAVSAMTGGDTKNIFKAAAVGAAAGAGYKAYREHQNNPGGTYTTPQGNTPAPVNYPTATRTQDPTVVVSPYKPYNKVRVSAFKPGDLAKDPTTQQIFVVPN